MGGSGSRGSGYPGSVMETAEEKVARVELENARLRDRVARVAERPGELERRPGLNGGNSGKPPSSDSLKKPAAERRTRSLRGKTGRQPGGQAGHEGRTLCRTGVPDRVKEHVPAVCRGCGASLRSAIAGAVKLSPEGEPCRIRLAPIGDFSARSLRAFVAGTPAPGARVMAEGWRGYCGLPDHDRQPRVVGATPAHLVLWIHRVFSNLKRRALGTCHGLRRAHLRRYLDEGVFRWNRRRHTATAFDTPLGIGTRLRPADCRDSAGQHVRSPQAGRQPPPALRSASIGAECRPANLHDSARNQLPQVQTPANPPARSENRAWNVECRSTYGVTGSKGISHYPEIHVSICALGIPG